MFRAQIYVSTTFELKENTARFATALRAAKCSMGIRLMSARGRHLAADNSAIAHQELKSGSNETGAWGA
jgi:hypothetical protein